MIGGHIYVEEGTFMLRSEELTDVGQNEGLSSGN